MSVSATREQQILAALSRVDDEGHRPSNCPVCGKRICAKVHSALPARAPRALSPGHRAANCPVCEKRICVQV